MDLSAPSVVVEGRRGFTLIEVLVVVGIISIMLLAAFFSLGRLQVTADTQTSIDKLLATIQSQRMAAMLGTGVGDKEATAQGVYFAEGTSKYVAFSCEGEQACQYSPTSGYNTEHSMEPSMIFSSISFPNDQIIFIPYSGELSNYIEGQNTIEITSTTGETISVVEVSSVGTPTLLP